MDRTSAFRFATRWPWSLAATFMCISSLAGAPLHDVDGDGRDELLLRNAQYGSWLYYDIDSRRARLRRIGGATTNLAYEVAGTGDFDGDGAAEMLLRHRDGGAWLHYAVQGRRAKLTRVADMTTNQAYRPVAVGDFDGGGTQELLLRDIADGHWAAYDGIPAAPELRRLSGLTADFALRLEGVGDFDGDGGDEVLLRHATDGSWLVANPDGAEADAKVIAGLPASADHRPSGVGDFDGDGMDEVMLRHAEGTWHPYDIAGTEATAASLTHVTTNLDYAPAGVGDVDGDGDDELLLRHAKGGQWIYYALADGRGSLLRPAGATRNRDWRLATTASDPLVRADRSIVQYLAGHVSEDKSPGLFAAIFDENGVRAAAAAGVRKYGSPEKITVDDIAHIGSNTKAMTTVMLATLVADGTFDRGWETTLIDVFPEWADEMHADYQSVTLWQLVTHTGGVGDPPGYGRREWGRDHLQLTSLVEQRYAIVRDNLASAPAGPVGEFIYSNVGYLVAGAMAEKLTDRSWEELMAQRLFAPLGMSNAGFEIRGEPGEVEQPWGHRLDRETNQWQPLQYHGYSAFAGPPATVSVSFSDWAKFVALFFPNNAPRILDRAALDKLTTPESPGYGGGFGVAQREWARGLTLGHRGGNGSWSTQLLIAPNLGRAYVVVANADDDYPVYPRTLGVIFDVVSDIIYRDLVNHALPPP